VLPSTLPGPDYPALTELLRRQVDMQIADLRLLMRLPSPDLDPDVGCNLTTAAMMLNLISGFSAWLFQTDEVAEIVASEGRKRRPESGWRFKSFVRTYWPRLDPEPVSADGTANRLYEVRNSLVHDLGIHNNLAQQEAHETKLAKHALPLEEIALYERTVSHPLAVPVVEERGPITVVHLTGVYWALHRMLRTALEDQPTEIEHAVAAIELPDIQEARD
jgi:hypothetical protein